MRRHTAVVLAALLVAGAAAFAGGCGSMQPRHTDTARQRLLRTGARVFAVHCQTCHPLLGRPDGRVHSDFYPGLDLDQVSPAPAFARRMVAVGFVGMGGFEGVLSTARQRAVVAYVLAVGGREVSPPPGVSTVTLTHGRTLYEEHCQVCHQLRGRAATNPERARIGTDFDELRPGVLWTERIVRDGLRMTMPAFRDRLSLRETRALALYVNAAARGGLPPLR